MDFDIGTLIYFIAIALFLYRSFTKKKKPALNKPRRSATEEQQTERRPSFEDLLKEFTGVGDEVEEATIEKAQQEQPQTTWEEVKSTNSPQRQGIKERALEKGFGKESLEEQLVFEEEHDGEDEPGYREMFDDYGGARKAFVASEVFRRKY